MPDHMHWLFDLTGEVPLSRVVASLKNHTTRRINERSGRHGSLWQPGFHDHALRREEDLKATARYVLKNPLRAGLVTSLRDYPHWDALWVSHEPRPAP